jgi:hypothetical protein
LISSYGSICDINQSVTAYGLVVRYSILLNDDDCKTQTISQPIEIIEIDILL